MTLADGTALRMMFKDLSPRLPGRGRAAREAGVPARPAARDRGLPRPARRRRARHARVLRLRRRPGARPLLAVHRERRGPGAVAGRRVRGVGGDGALAGAHARRARAGRRRAPASLLRYGPEPVPHLDRPRPRVRASDPRHALGATTTRAVVLDLAGALRAGRRAARGAARRPSSTASSIPRTCSCRTLPARSRIAPIDWEIAAVGPGPARPRRAHDRQVDAGASGPRSRAPTARRRGRARRRRAARRTSTRRSTAAACTWPSRARLGPGLAAARRAPPRLAGRGAANRRRVAPLARH